MLQELFFKILILSLSGTIIFSIITILRPVTDKLFSPTWRYYLLIITITTFIIPYGLVMPELQNPLTDIVKSMEVREVKNQGIKNQINAESNLNREYSSKPEEKTQESQAVENLTKEILNENNQGQLVNIKEILGTIWILGSIGFLANGFIRVFSFNRNLKNLSKDIEREDIKIIFHKCCEELKVKKRIDIKICHSIGTPMVMGIINPVIILPREDLNLDLLRMVFNHELMHYKQRDLWIKSIAFITRSIHWFNPVAYMVNRELNKACELNCDWKIIKDMDNQEKNYYGLAILDTINHSLDNRGILSTAMADSSKNELKRRLTMIKMKKSPKRLITVLSIITAVIVTLTSTSVANVFGKNVRDNKSVAVIVKGNELLSVDLISNNMNVIDKGNILKTPIISPKGEYVAYTKDGTLYIGNISSNKQYEAIKGTSNVTSYGWQDDGVLVYSTEEGGLKAYELNNKKYSSYIKSENRYEGITGDGNGNIYAEEYRYYTKDGQQYIENKGVISFNANTLENKLIIPSMPMNEEAADMGLRPKIAGISKDGNYLYIWRKTVAGSLNADGVPFGTYDVKNGKFIPCKDENIFALAYNDNLAINPLDGKLPVINNGGVRNMNINKTLGMVDVTSCSFTNILPESMIATDGLYGLTAKGMVTMTPSFSLDGKIVAFSGAKATENVEDWNSEAHNIYSVNPDTKKVEKLTKANTFDFAPVYISTYGDLAFLRKTAENKASLWKLQGSTEKLVVDGINLDEDAAYYGHYNMENILDIYIGE